MFTIAHRIAGITIRTESDSRDAGLSFLRIAPFKPFQVQEEKPDICRKVRSIAPETLTLPPPTGKEARRIERAIRIGDGQDCLMLCSPVVRARLEECLRYHPEHIGLELRRTSVSIYDFFGKCQHDTFYHCSLEESMACARVGHIFFAYFLPVFSAAMLHCAGLVLNRRTALFLAPDAGGKSTAIGLSKKGTTLCDDQVIIRKESGAFIAHSTPWGMVNSGPMHANLGGLFLLEKAENFELVQAKPIDALEYLWNEHRGLRLLLPKRLRLRTYELFYDACHQVPVYRMRFTKDYVDWDAVEAVMEGKVAS